jgi:hypothetical protein
MKSFWVSWYHNFKKHGEFELHSPWSVVCVDWMRW